MNQYSPKNQIFLTAQAAERGMPPLTDVRSCKAWNAVGRSIIKGEKALRVWIPKRGKAIPADLSTMTEAQEREYFVRGPVFDISQTKECAPRHRKAAETDRRIAAGWSEMDAEFTAYHQAIAAGEIPADFDFDIWHDLRKDSIRIAASDYADYTIVQHSVDTHATL